MKIENWSKYSRYAGFEGMVDQEMVNRRTTVIDSFDSRNIGFCFKIEKTRRIFMERDLTITAQLSSVQGFQATTAATFNARELT